MLAGKEERLSQYKQLREQLLRKVMAAKARYLMCMLCGRLTRAWQLVASTLNASLVTLQEDASA